ncbi:transcriptional regulator [Planobispora rosea]|uniref:Transcriptional regulator n=1 Tax=Planobispora rosea TaxID=35762 RepID=A0A8J3RXT6_PLARO|nr:SpoIIE family protein phosphatase [Planobispora rosea]GGS47482.1 transcriptional regulator [Planobispora rosea]GIH82206.1 transcriptional regulator [Planobispora rosea]
MGTVIPSQNDVWTRAEDASVIGSLRRAAVTLAQARGFGEKDTGRMAVAVSEAASNLVKHAVEGVMLIRPHPELPSAIEIVAVDRGPGMHDVPRALRDGYSTTGTLGIGLGGIARMASAYEIHSVPGTGTVVAMCFIPRGASLPPFRVGGMSRPIGEEIVCGDAYTIVESDSATTVMVCDGLGHGDAAAHASREAGRVFQQEAERAALAGTALVPAAVVEQIHRGLTRTRGGAVAVARLDRATGVVRFAGLGNVSAWIAHPEGRQGLISVPGIAGHQAPRTLRQYEYAMPSHGVLVLHSDGLSDRWNPASYPGLITYSPSVIAATLLRDAGTRRDDACVVVVRPET